MAQRDQKQASPTVPVQQIVRLVYLPVNDKTGEVDYDYIPYDIEEQDIDAPEHKLIDGWHFKPFKLIPA